ncbi:ATP-binding protein [Paragemmobacter straminiformis]
MALVLLCLLVLLVLAAPAERGLTLLLMALGAMASGGLVYALRTKGVQAARSLRRWSRRAPAPPRRVIDFDSLPVPLLRLDDEGGLVAANAAARRMIGLRDGALPPVHELFEDLGRPVADWIAEVAGGRHPGGAEVLRLRGAGRDPDSFVQLALEPLGEGEVLGVLQDATAMKRLEVQFTQSQKMQAIGQLAGGVAHDFNNLLTAINGHCELLLMRHAPGDLDHADLDQIQQNARRAAALVRQLLAFSRKQTLVPERIDLTEVLGEVSHLLNRLLGGSVTLDLHHVAVGVAIRADRQQFEQVVTNLAVNARDAMPLGGVLRITTDVADLAAPMPRDSVTVPAGRYATIRIRDTGTGIAAEHLDKIFEPFFTTKRAGEGTGLGLSTVYGIVKQSGGYVFVESVPGEGTEFQLWFPALREEAPRAKPAPARSRARAPVEGVVLLVEDEAPVRAFAARALRLRGLTVLEAGSGEEALAVLENAGLCVDLLLSDLVLPGLDGPSWVGQALRKRPGLPVVFMSGYAADSPSASQGKVPNSVFLAKPFTLADLGDLVSERIAGGKAQISEALSVS